MTERTHIDEIVRFPDLVLLELSKNPLFVSLLTNIPDASLDDKDTAAKWNICTNNYIAVDETITDAMSFCCVDTRIKMDGTEVVDAYIDILVGVHRDVMSLRDTAFTGLSGNRRDNLIREIDYTLRGSHAFGIGGLEPDGYIEPVKTANSPLFACKVIHFKVATFGRSRNINRGKTSVF